MNASWKARQCRSGIFGVVPEDARRRARATARLATLKASRASGSEASRAMPRSMRSAAIPARRSSSSATCRRRSLAEHSKRVRARCLPIQDAVAIHERLQRLRTQPGRRPSRRVLSIDSSVSGTNCGLGLGDCGPRHPCRVRSSRHSPSTTSQSAECAVAGGVLGHIRVVEIGDLVVPVGRQRAARDRAAARTTRWRRLRSRLGTRRSARCRQRSRDRQGPPTAERRPLTRKTETDRVPSGKAC